MKRLVLVLLMVLNLILPAVAKASEASEPLHPAWAPVVVPFGFVLPGSGHLLRGERATAWKLFVRGGLGFGALLAGGVLVASTGAASVVMPPLIPVLLLAGSTFMASGSADIAGAFSPAGLRFEDAPARVLGVSYLHVPNRIFESHSYLRVEARWIRDAEARAWGAVTSDAMGRNIFLEADAGYAVLSWDEQLEGIQPSQLVLRLGGLHERNPDSLYSATRLQPLAEARLPLAHFSPTLASALLELRAGYQFRWTHYDSELAASDDFLTGVAGGFTMNWRAADRVRALWGYEHARDGLIGGIGTGYFGHFTLGAGYRVASAGWIQARAYFGYPLSYQLGWETSW